jgi:hypothetical protein
VSRRAVLPLLPLMAGLALAWVFGLLWAYSDTGVSVVTFLAACYGAAFFFVALSLWWFFSQKPRRAPRALRLVTPACMAIALLLIAAGEPPGNPLFRLRFAASEAALLDFARQRLTRPADAPSRWVGLFEVGAVDVADGQVRLFTASCGVIDRCGLVYVSAGEPRRVGKDRFTPLGDGWFHLVERF